MIQSIVFNIHTFEEKVSKVPVIDETDSIIDKVIELFSESEPTRQFFDEKELDEILSNSEGFDIIFEPPLQLAGSLNSLSKVHFLTRGELSNSPDKEEVIFLAALDGEVLNNPMIAYNCKDIYNYLEAKAFR